MQDHRPTFAITGARVLIGNELRIADVLVENGSISAIDQTNFSGPTIQAEGLLLLPGLVDLHGDAFERALCPRPGVEFPVDQALVENDRAMLAAGITTGFLSITDSFEPGLRSRDRLRSIMHALHRTPDIGLGCDTKIHIRHELCQTADFEELTTWLQTDQVHLLSIADHLPPADDQAKTQRYLRSLDRRISLSNPAELIATAQRSKELGLNQQTQLSVLAKSLQISLASHDDADPETVSQNIARGVSIVEFPANLATAHHAITQGASILLGAPNAVRGRSHLGLMTVKHAIDAGLSFLLSSDYHYASLTLAPFLLAERGELAFAKAWYNASRDCAFATGLRDRGEIRPGARADLILIEPHHRGPRVVQTMVAGVPVFATRFSF